MLSPWVPGKDCHPDPVLVSCEPTLAPVWVPGTLWGCCSAFLWLHQLQQLGKDKGNTIVVSVLNTRGFGKEPPGNSELAAVQLKTWPFLLLCHEPLLILFRSRGVGFEKLLVKRFIRRLWEFLPPGIWQRAVFSLLLLESQALLTLTAVTLTLGQLICFYVILCYSVVLFFNLTSSSFSLISSLHWIFFKCFPFTFAALHLALVLLAFFCFTSEEVALLLVCVLHFGCQPIFTKWLSFLCLTQEYLCVNESEQRNCLTCGFYESIWR